jgi:YD repeat-containing protein
MPAIQLTRTHDAGGIFRRMTFHLDGRAVARLRRGQSRLIEVPAGMHVVTVSMDWLRSDPLRLVLTEESSISLSGALTESSVTFTKFFLKPQNALELIVN